MDEVQYRIAYQVVADCPKCGSKMVQEWSVEPIAGKAFIRCPDCGNVFILGGLID